MLTLKVATVATLVVLVFGVGWAYLFGRFRFRGSQILDAVLTLPMVMPPTVLGYYLLVVIGRRGWIGEWLEKTFGIRLIFTWQGAVIASALVPFPLVFKAVRAALESVDHHLESTARVLGSNEARFRDPQDFKSPRARFRTRRKISVREKSHRHFRSVGRRQKRHDSNDRRIDGGRSGTDCAEWTRAIRLGCTRQPAGAEAQYRICFSGLRAISSSQRGPERWFRD